MQEGGCSAEGMEPFALRVLGDSMLPEFEEGHIIVVDPGYPLVSGAFAVLDLEGEILFGQYIRRGAQQWLQYLNPAYGQRELTGPFRVKGVVTQRNTRRRKDTKHYDYPLLP
jgi:DNA polymerase V